MAQLLIRNLPEETVRALKARAALRDGRPSLEAEAREILIEAAQSSLGLGSRLRKIAAPLHADPELALDATEVDELFARSTDAGRRAFE